MMTKFTFATQPRYDRTHGNITYSADSQPSRFSFNIRIVALYIKTHTEFQFTVRFNFQRVHVNLSIYIYMYIYCYDRSKDFKKNRISQN